MITLYGNWYDGRTSAQVLAVCRIYDNGAVRVEKTDADMTPLFADGTFRAEVSPRLGDTPRYLSFPAGAKFETLDNDGVDAAMRQFKRASWTARIHLLESKKRYWLMGLILMALLVWGWVNFAVPGLARAIAFRLPPAVLQHASRETLEILDRKFVKASELPLEVRRKLRRHFAPVLKDHPDLDLKIVFRKGGRIGANAFALPNGTILLTDEIVELAADKSELTAVLAHEIAHIRYRHALRALIQDSILGFMILAFTGDVSGTSEMFLGLPVVLTQLAYSRQFEREADQYARRYMQTHGIALIHFANLMRRMEAQRREKNGEKSSGWKGYLSTHPLTEERLIPFEKGQPPSEAAGNI